jgi:hypothetical protein
MAVMICLACNCSHVDADVEIRAIFGDDIVAKSPQKFIDPIISGRDRSKYAETCRRGRTRVWSGVTDEHHGRQTRVQWQPRWLTDQPNKMGRPSDLSATIAIQSISYSPTVVELDFRLIDIERSAKSTKGHARALHVYVLFIALVTAFWSAFVWWRNYDDVTAFFHALASRVLVFHPFS